MDHTFLDMSAIVFQLVSGIVTFVLGIALVYWIKRRKFNRRNMAGLEGFSSFESSVLVRFLEFIGKWVGYALIILGLLLFWSYSGMKKEKEKEQLKITTEQPAQR